jgi:hypothetical protein
MTTYHLSFQEYLDLNEAGLLQKWQNRILGRDEEGRTSLDKAHLTRHASDITGAATAATGIAQKGTKLAVNVATGNVVGAAVSIWGLISDAISGGSKAYKATKAALYVTEVKKHMTQLKKHLLENEELEEEAANAIIDAVFEVDEEIFDDIPANAWAEGTKRFAAGLAQGYDTIGDKIFAAVMAVVMKEWVEKMGGKAEGLKDIVTYMRGQRKQKIDFLSEPEVQEAMAEFEPPRVEKDLEDEVQQKSGVIRTVAQLREQIIKTLGWPRLPKNGDIGLMIYENQEYCKGPITLNEEIGQNWDIQVIQKWGWDQWIRGFRVQGKIKTIGSRCRWNEAYFGYETGLKNVMKWDARRNAWIVNIDPD